MLNFKQLFGRNSEQRAAGHLKKLGYRILERNYRTRLGEVDIIARDGASIVFVEVKARHSRRFGPPKAAVTAAKQRKLSMVALEYLKSTGQMQAKARFDVLSIVSDAGGDRVELIKNAFQLAYG
jgi:putative endonuclease